MTDITFTDLNLTNSSIVNVMNVVRFYGSNWIFAGTLTATSNLASAFLFSTNQLMLNSLKIRPEECTSFILNKVTLFKTPPYSLLLESSYQINHRYINIIIKNVKIITIISSFHLKIHEIAH